MEIKCYHPSLTPHKRVSISEWDILVGILSQTIVWVYIPKYLLWIYSRIPIRHSRGEIKYINVSIQASHCWYLARFTFLASFCCFHPAWWVRIGIKNKSYSISYYNQPFELLYPGFFNCYRNRMMCFTWTDVLNKRKEYHSFSLPNDIPDTTQEW